MAIIEVDGDEFAKLQAELTSTRAHKVTLDRLGKNPKTRTPLLRLLKEADPSLAIPELDAAQPVLDEVAKERAAREALEKRLDEKDAERAKQARAEAAAADIEKERAKLRGQGWSDEGVEKVEKLMQERGLVDYDAAAALFEKQQPAKEEILPGFGKNWDLFNPPEDDNDIRAALSPNRATRENALKRWQAKEIQKAIAEARGGVVQRL